MYRVLIFIGVFSFFDMAMILSEPLIASSIDGVSIPGAGHGGICYRVTKAANVGGSGSQFPPNQQQKKPEEPTLWSELESRPPTVEGVRPRSPDEVLLSLKARMGFVETQMAITEERWGLNPPQDPRELKNWKRREVDGLIREIQRINEVFDRTYGEARTELAVDLNIAQERLLILIKKGLVNKSPRIQAVLVGYYLEYYNQL